MSPIKCGNLDVLFVTTGYPTASRPNQCIFIHRSIKSLSPFISPQVIHFRTWLPGRPILEQRTWDGVNVTTIACPQLPGGSYLHINALLLALFGGTFINPFIKAADILHSTDIYPAGYVAHLWAKRFKKPNTTHVIGSDLSLFLQPNLRMTGIKWLNDIDGFVCNSQSIKDQLISLVPSIKNVQVIYRGVDTTIFSSSGTVVGPQVSMPPVRFLYLGGFHTWDSKRGEYNIKGGHTLLEAWSKIERQVGLSSLVIAGPGSDSNNLQDWHSTLHRPNSVFIAGTISPNEVASWIRACDVVVIPSLQEGLPNVANEAQACGRPVLGTDAGGISESVVNQETGIIVPRGDTEALAGGLKLFWNNRNDLKLMGCRGRDRMMQQFSWDRFSQQMQSILNDAVQNKGMMHKNE